MHDPVLFNECEQFAHPRFVSSEILSFVLLDQAMLCLIVNHTKEGNHPHVNFNIRHVLGTTQKNGTQRSDIAASDNESMQHRNVFQDLSITSSHQT